MAETRGTGNAASMLRVHVQGAGKVGRTLGRALRDAGWPVVVRAQRRGLPAAVVADVVLLAVRDGQLQEVAARWAEAAVVPRQAVVLHLAGALGPEVLAPLRGHCRGLGQMHPMLCFASAARGPKLAGGHVLLDGDASAKRAGRRIAQALGMRSRAARVRDRVGYHAAAWLVAGGTVALAAAARDLLLAAGLPEAAVWPMLGPLVASVAGNLQTLGVPASLTGVVRRGDALTLGRHLDAVMRLAPQHAELFASVARAQLPLAAALGEVEAAQLQGVRDVLMALDGRCEHAEVEPSSDDSSRNV